LNHFKIAMDASTKAESGLLDELNQHGTLEIAYGIRVNRDLFD